MNEFYVCEFSKRFHKLLSHLRINHVGNSDERIFANDFSNYWWCTSVLAPNLLLWIILQMHTLQSCLNMSESTKHVTCFTRNEYHFHT